MIVVDSSVWIDHFNGVDAPHTATFARLVEADAALGIVDLMVAEILQGFRSERDADRAEHALLMFAVVPTNGVDDAIAAASLFRTARRAGITGRSTIDCLIAAVCIRIDSPLLHNDRDFDRLAEVSPLRVF